MTRITWAEFIDRLAELLASVRDLHPEDAEKIAVGFMESVFSCTHEEKRGEGTYAFWNDTARDSLLQSREDNVPPNPADKAH